MKYEIRGKYELLDGLFLTVTALHRFYGTDPFEVGQDVDLVIEPENKVDPDAICVMMEGLGQVGYVANSYKTAIGDSLTASKIRTYVLPVMHATVAFVLPDSNAVLLKINGSPIIYEGDTPPFEGKEYFCGMEPVTVTPITEEKETLN